MNKKLTFALVLVLVLILATGLVACNKKDNGPQVPDFVTPTVGATYGQTLGDLELPAGFTWEEPENTSVGNAGNNVFNVVFTPTDSINYNIVRNIPVTIAVAKADYDMSGVTLSGGQFTYDGTVKSLAISGQLPEGVSVQYEGNGQVNAGTHVVRAHFTTGDANHNNPEARRSLCFQWLFLLALRVVYFQLLQAGGGGER